MNTIQSQWETFAAAVLPQEAPEVQRSEMRRAFYAGSYGMLCQMTGPVAEVSEEAGCAMIDGYVKECEQFKLDVLAGRA